MLKDMPEFTIKIIFCREVEKPAERRTQCQRTPFKIKVGGIVAKASQKNFISISESTLRKVPALTLTLNIINSVIALIIAKIEVFFTGTPKEFFIYLVAT